ncbi:MAG: LemA family protein [Rhodospirillales bacterium]|nr:LemA family protein [Rhodospirillales bacterium]
MMDWLPYIIAGAIVLYAIVIYNRLVALRNTRFNAFSDIDVQLKLRFNLVPQLVETVKGYAKHEKGVFETVTEARAAVSKTEGAGAERAAAESFLGRALTGLLAVAENYPDLKADASFRQLMTELSDIENKVAAARRFFNAATNEFNTYLQQIPNNLIAKPFGFKEEPFFELEDGLEEQIRKAPEVKF